MMIFVGHFLVMTLSVTVCQHHTDTRKPWLARDVRTDLSQHKVTVGNEANEHCPTPNPTCRPLLHTNTKQF